MDFKMLAIVVAGVAAVVTFSIVSMIAEPKPEPVSIIDFTYDDSNKIKEILKQQKISMSSPLEISGNSVKEYCTFFDDQNVQRFISYCTSTELKDADGKFLGNIHMAGNPDMAIMSLAIIQVDPFMSQEDDLKLIYQTMIDTLVCDCWEDKTPGGFASVSDWLDEAKNRHLEAKKTTSNSKIGGLAQKQLLLEITTNTEGYLWKLIVGK